MPPAVCAVLLARWVELHTPADPQMPGGMTNQSSMWPCISTGLFIFTIGSKIVFLPLQIELLRIEVGQCSAEEGSLELMERAPLLFMGFGTGPYSVGFFRLALDFLRLKLALD